MTLADGGIIPTGSRFVLEPEGAEAYIPLGGDHDVATDTS